MREGVGREGKGVEILLDVGGWVIVRRGGGNKRGARISPYFSILFAIFVCLIIGVVIYGHMYYDVPKYPSYSSNTTHFFFCSFIFDDFN
jgi:CDP-diglyceride synthetase